MKPKKPSLKTPLFISFEGGEGAGKTTLIDKLSTTLDQAGHNVIVTREPGGTRLGDHIRDLLLHEKDLDICYKAELLLFLAARAQHVEEVIAPALSENKIVLCDRFNDSSLAYQGFARGLGMDLIKPILAFAASGIEPDLTFFLDVDPKVGLERAVNEGTRPDRIEEEKQNFHNLVRSAFLSIAKEEPGRVKVIDAHQSPEKVFEEAEMHLYSIKR